MCSAPGSVDDELSTEDVVARFRQQAEEEQQRRNQMQADRRPHIRWQQEEVPQRQKERKVSFPGEKKRRPTVAGKRKSPSGKAKSQSHHE